MSLGEKPNMAEKLYYTARRPKTTVARHEHPDRTEEEIEKKNQKFSCMPEHDLLYFFIDS